MRDKAIVKHLPEDSRFSVSFIFAFKKNSPGRQFNLSRELSEDASQFLIRIQTNISKVIDKKKKKNEPNEKICVKFTSDSENFSIENFKTAGELIKFPGIKMDVNGCEYDVIVNPPLVEECKLAGALLTDTLIYPFKLQTVFSEECKFEWFLSKDPAETSLPPTSSKKPKLENLKSKGWVKRREGFFFKPENCDVGGRIRLDITPTYGESVGDTYCVHASSLVEAGPDTTPTQNRQQWTPTKSDYPCVRVMTYNLLADLYADSDFSRSELFPQCPPFALDIDYRTRLIINELINFHPDIICLQENDRKVFKHNLVPVLSQFGLKGEFSKKGGQVDEGVSLFYREDKFHLLESRGVVLSEVLRLPKFAHLLEKMSPELLERMEARTTAISVTILRSVHQPRNLVVVGNTHLFFKPDADHIRLLQLEMCLIEIKSFREEMIEKYPGSNIAVLLCGDFNSTPPFGVLKYCTEGMIPSDYPDWTSAGAEEKVEGLSLAHTFCLGSAAGTPKYTNYTVGFKDCLDYIFYDKTQFSVDQVIPFPTEEELSLHEALPNVSFPSDHISVVADLRWLSEHV